MCIRVPDKTKKTHTHIEKGEIQHLKKSFSRGAFTLFQFAHCSKNNSVQPKFILEAAIPTARKGVSERERERERERNRGGRGLSSFPQKN